MIHRAIERRSRPPAHRRTRSRPSPTVMTVTTNALLEGRAARTALVATVTDGFTDLVELSCRRAPTLPPVRGASTGPGSFRRCVSRSPNEPGSAWCDPCPHRAGLRWPSSSPAHRSRRSPSCCWHACFHPGHELAVRDALRRRSQRSHLDLRRGQLDAAREQMRGATTESAGRRALMPLLRGHLANLTAIGSKRRGLPDAAVMQSSGGLTSAAISRTRTAHGSSGPAGGAQGARLIAGQRARATSCASTWAAPRATSA